MGKVIRLPGTVDFPFMPPQNVNMGVVVGHLKNFLEAYNYAQSDLFWAHFEQELREHVSGFTELKIEKGTFSSTVLTITTQGSLGSFSYSVKLYGRFFKK
jgi:hypothetical protein